MRRHGGALAAALAAALVMAACGGGGSGAAGKNAGGGTAPPTKATTTTAATATAKGSGSESSGSKTVWLCRPGNKDNPCEGDFTTSVIGPDGKTTVSKARVATHPKIDCFYVYPTVSGQPGPNANLTIDPAERGVARSQAARFSQACRVYAPMYRQLTLSAINNRGSITPAVLAKSYGDVEAAWKDYLAHDNHGRGVVLIGHSQGAGQLQQLIRNQIDGNPKARKLLVSALLLGGNVTVPIGKDVGGSFDHVPACRKDGQTGCVVAYSSYLNTPPANGLFGRARRPGNQVLCTNPAALAGGKGDLLPEFPTGEGGAVGSINRRGPSDARPWVAYPDLYTGECQDRAGANVLHVTPTPGPGDKRPVATEAIGPIWGLHLVDVNIGLGNLVDVVKDQARAYTDRDR
jgi:Protein of unknown function (DUF3089)